MFDADKILPKFIQYLDQEINFGAQFIDSLVVIMQPIRSKSTN